MVAQLRQNKPVGRTIFSWTLNSSHRFHLTTLSVTKKYLNVFITWTHTHTHTHTHTYIYIYIYIYIYCHPETDCFVVSQLFCVARHVGRLKLGSKPTQIYVRLSIGPLGQQAYHVRWGNYKVLSSNVSLFTFYTLPDTSVHISFEELYIMCLCLFVCVCVCVCARALAHFSSGDLFTRETLT